MKRIAASVGLAALGAASVHGVYGQAFSAVDPAKPWSVSAALRGFYDDNVGTVRSGKTHTFGYELNPSAAVDIVLEQTELALNYAYSYKYYEKRPNSTGSKNDQTHTATGLLTHSFGERLRMSVNDSFVVGQEPDLLRVPNQNMSAFNRIPGNNYRNYGTIVFDSQITRELGVQVGYANSFFKYADHLDPSNPLQVDQFGDILLASRAGLLDRLEHSAHIDGRWQVQPETVGFVGYQYGQVDYTGNEVISGNVFGGPSFLTGDPFLTSDVRNNRSHYGYVGVDHNFTADLVTSVRAGVRYTEYYNSPDNATTVAPYAQGSIRYQYTKDSFAELGVTHDRSATDLFTVNQNSNNSITRDSDSTTAYGSIRHRLLPNLYGSVMGSFQYSTFDGGTIDKESERFYEGGVNLEYQFNRHLAANVGYNYDKLDSDVSGRGFERNRVFIGATASY